MESSEERPTGAGQVSAEEARRQRERESLRLTRSRVLQQLEVAQEPRYVKQLNDALQDLNNRIAKLQ